MSEYIVAYDRDKQIAVIVDVDNRVGYGPAMIGPDAERLLEGFLLTIPYDISGVDTLTLRDWFEAYVEGVGGTLSPSPTTPSESVVEPAGRTELDEAAEAQREAVAESAAPPPAQPADTDTPQNPSEAATVGPCWNCQGQRMVPGPDGKVVCGVCKGTGQLPAPETTTA